MNRRTLLLTLLVALLAVGTNWLSRQSGKEAKQAEAAKSAPDYFIASFTATELDLNGRPLNQFDGAHLAHYPDQEMVVHQPHLVVYQQDKVPWQVTARLARSRTNEDQVVLSGDVRLFREGAEPAAITTENLQLQPKHRTAETADPITLTDPGGKVDAVGMQADLNQQRVTLHSRVRGTYEAP